MTLVQVVWIVALWLALVLVNVWNTPGVFAAAARQVLTWIIGAGVIYWAIILFRVLGTFGWGTRT